MKKIFDLKVTKILALLSLFYMLYVAIMIVFDTKDLENLFIWEKIIITIAFFLPGIGNLYYKRLSNTILGISSLALSVILAWYWFL